MKLDILFVCNKPLLGNDANTIVDHIEAFENYSSHNIWLCSNLGQLSKKLQLEKFDAIIIHYSICLLSEVYLDRPSKERIKRFKGLKIAFIQDEYRQINKMIEELAYIDLDILFTCFPGSEIERIYPSHNLPKVAKFNNLTGYIPERLAKVSNQTPISNRPIHVGYRGRKTPFWLGELAYEKWNIVDKWQQYTADTMDLKVDISYHESDRIYGSKWVEFLSSCKTTLGVESGASVMDFTGDLEKNINMHQLTHPNDSFYSIQNKFLLEHEGKYKLNQISPRCFEAIALKTVLVLYEGEYSGILEPNRHFIPLKKDFSNIAKVMKLLKDDLYLQRMADRAFNEIALNPDYSYHMFVKRVDEIIMNGFLSHQKQKVKDTYTDDLFASDLIYRPLKKRIYTYGLKASQKLPARLRLFVKGCVRPIYNLQALSKKLSKIMRFEFK
ncbi:hypothetical protein [Legionella impletisoli]|uniref:Uncharacterized protein n=1 Tax=Legionella impletisoli TaxID=343510 RepID=A0A917JRD8_9GAMM|nr:hypothetical protein [Legionella impletisoli]GGI80107.1 hypothetical protein GCM10007966_05770 [Legionella impletisoli]